MKRLLLTILAASLALAVAAGLALTASLPRRDGAARVAGLAAPVAVEVDRVGVPRLAAASFADALRAQGFVHAQERYFQMDLTRRGTAGELAALFGEAALPRDLERRVFQFRKRARALAQALPAEQLEWLLAYVDGVNAGLADLGARPPEYWLLRAEPEPWTLEDSLLVVYAFYTMLSSNEAYERPQAVMRAALAPSVFRFLTPSSSRFDRPLDADAGASGPADPTGGYAPIPIPPPGDVGPLGPPPGRRIVRPPLTGAASNQWAIGAGRSASRAAIIANDPHLSLGLPNVFHRSELLWDGGVVRGLGIPGVPGIVIGASAGLAWGVTVSNADQSDWVVVEPDAEDPSSYRTPDGRERFVVERETIAVRGRDEPATLDVRLTRWGPIVAEDGLGRALALKAAWLEPDGIDLDIMRLAFAGSVREGLDVLSGWSGPSLNWMLADAAGEIGWIVNGPLPIRVGFDGSVPESWADGTRGWQGRRPPPSVHGGRDAVLFTANNRVLGAERAAALGRMWMRPFRAKRIADLIGAKRMLDEADFVAMQLDTRAEAYDRIRDVALEALADDEGDALLRAVRRALEDWDGHADASTAGFRLLHVYYRALLERLLAPLLTPALAVDPGFVYRWPLADEPMRRLLDERPAHLLPPGFADWDAFLRDVLVDAMRALAADPARPDPATPWGDVNRLRIGHPLSGLPLVGPLLRVPAVPQAGSTVSVRVAEPDRGAVIRMVVSPARPEAGVLQMVGGQSGHFLSPHFKDQQASWADGAPAPFLAGAAAETFVLSPLERALD